MASNYHYFWKNSLDVYLFSTKCSGKFKVDNRLEEWVPDEYHSESDGCVVDESNDDEIGETTEPKDISLLASRVCFPRCYFSSHMEPSGVVNRWTNLKNLKSMKFHFSAAFRYSVSTTVCR